MILVGFGMAICGCSTTSTSTYSIGGTVSGLAGAGLVLQNYGASNLAVTANGSFSFAAGVTSGGPYSGAYNITILTQPSNPSQNCGVINGSGNASTSVTNVEVICSTVTYTVGGVVSGLSGSGLQLQDNGGNTLAINANGSFTFPTAVATGSSYSVTVSAQPSTSPLQTCVVTNGSGVATANVTSVQVTCTTTNYTIAGAVINLAGMGGGLQLQDNGGNTLLVNANGPFTFPTALAPGTSYDVTVSVQPSSPVQNCLVMNGTGVAMVNVTTVIVNCGQSDWIWVNGANVSGQPGTYGTEGMANGSNIPGGRNGAVRWKDTSGNFWLFGGYGLDSGGSSGYLNDLWEYSGGLWTWKGGSNVVDQPGTYGALDSPVSGNIPGARQSAVSWTDASGNFWLFGGLGYDSVGNYGFLNDLWEYSGGLWAWKGGSSLVNQQGTYGTQGTPASSNIPGARQSAVGWTDASGNLWLFSGNGLGETQNLNGILNDLWEYRAGEWTWVAGSNTINQQGFYNAQGTPGIPGARQLAVAWSDTSGNLWLFGGAGLGLGGNFGYLNDLWEYSAGQWIWAGGSNQPNQQATYGFTGVGASSNTPGGRSSAIAWTDNAGNFWMLGGNGYGSTANEGSLNDLWEYTAGQWTWMGGSNTINQPGTYGTKGAPTPGNVPGSRQLGVGWTDGLGNLWLFGGDGYDSTGTVGYLNDVWEYKP